MKNKFAIFLSISVVLVLLGISSGVLGLRSGSLGRWLSGPNVGQLKVGDSGSVKVVSEESVTIDVVKRVSPAVVTVGITKNQPVFDFNQGFGFGPFGFFESPVPQQQGSRQIKQDIGSGFIVRSDGLIITNKHVVSDTQAKYRVITVDNRSYDVQRIYRDPNNDLAILKIDASGLPTVELGDSSRLQVGQFAIAIGTALGEFRSTVTTGVVSGLSRGITAGSPFEGAEKLNDVIQTSAAINPGNSGGPLLNSSGQVIGVNVAVASAAQNIGFALPINLLKDSLKTFEENGQFPKRAFLGVEYRMVTRDLAILNEIPEGAYVSSVVAQSPAEEAGLEPGDIITKIDGRQLRETEGGLAAVIAAKKPGQTVELTVYQADGKTVVVRATLTEATQ
ncbi:MAG: Protease Do [Microgenomates group bacterium GW2011_GWA1_48_10]|nr:MAG: Protease Do [Microgenomates group bacterium GW2011_GWA1_48_10]